MKCIEELAEEFLCLGGKTNNIIIGLGCYGRGIFQKDSNQKSSIFIPKELFLPTSNLTISNQKARILDDVNGNRTSKFFEDYVNLIISEKEFSAATLLDEFNPNNLPEELSHCRKYLFNHDDNLDALILHKFTTTRAFSYQNLAIIAPIWDLVNHSQSAYSFESNHRGLTTPSINTITKNGEVLFRYNLIFSPLGRALIYKFTCEEAFCFSIPFRFQIPDTDYFIQCLGNQAPGATLKKSSNLQKRGNSFSFNSLPIASLQKGFVEAFFVHNLPFLQNKKKVHQLL